MVVKNGDTNYYVGANDIVLEVDLPQSILAPPEVGYKQTLIVVKEESMVKWTVK